jgi:hypothetical protein
MAGLRGRAGAAWGVEQAPSPFFTILIAENFYTGKSLLKRNMLDS